MEFEDIIFYCGGYGRFQKYLKMLFLLPVSIVVPWFSYTLIYMVDVPDHWCYVPDIVLHSNLSVTQQRSLISPPHDPSCSVFNASYSALMCDENVTLPDDLPTIPCPDGWIYDKEDFDYTAATEWDMVCNRSHFPSLILTLKNVGNIIGTPVYGFLADRFGRKAVFFASVLLVSVTELSSVLIRNLTTFMVLRAINGTLMYTVSMLPYLLSLELTPPEQRGHMNGIYSTAWSIGMCILPLIVYLSRNWVILGFVNAVAGIGMLFYWWYIPESPCWLVSQGRYEEAAAIMKKIGEVNGLSPDPDLLLEKLQIVGKNIEKKREEEKKNSDLSLLKFPRLRRNFLILTFCCAALNVGYSGPIFNLNNLNGNKFINFFLMSVVELPGELIFWALMHRIGRRWTSSIGFFFTGIINLIPVLGFPYSGIVSSMIGKLLIAGIYVVITLQATELFPTVARSFGTGMGNAIANALTLFLPYIAYISLYGKSLPFIVISFTCIVAAILSSFLPETLNENLPQAISDAEDFGKDQKYFSWTKRNRSILDTPSS